MFFRASEPDDEELKSHDIKSTDEITFRELKALNDQRTENHLSYGNLLYVYYLLNLRTEFEPDDTFSQKTATWVHIYALKHQSNNESQAVAAGINDEKPDEDDEDGHYKKMSTVAKAEFNRARNIRNSLQTMCIVSLVTSGLALG